jgi:uncharacterized damage-inducible protein DinB
MMSPEQAKGMAAMMVDGILREAQITRKVIAAVPEDKVDFKLGEKGWPASKLARHIVYSEAWFANSIINGEFGEESEPEAPATIADLVKWYDETLPALTAKVGELSAEQLLKPLNFYNVFNMPAVMYLNFWSSHSIHHRGYLAAYLRAMNAKVPSIYGGSADEPFEMPAAAAQA